MKGYEDKTQKARSTAATDEAGKEQGPSEISTPTLSRRKLAVAGASASVMMSLFSRPVLGTTPCSPSALASGNASVQDRECNAQGCTPGFWKNNLDAWKHTGCIPGTVVKRDWRGRCEEMNSDGGTRFLDIFGFQPSIAQDATCTLLDVMMEHEKSGHIGTYENHVVAAYLNAAAAPAAYGTTCDQVVKLARCVKGLELFQGVQIDQADAMDLFVRMNEQGDCFLNAHGDFIEPGYSSDGQSVFPVCPAGYRYSDKQKACVRVS